MKLRKLAAVLTAACMVLGLAACSSGSTAATTAAATTAAATTAAPTTAAPTTAAPTTAAPAETKAPETTAAPAETKAPETTAAAAAAPKDFGGAELVIATWGWAEKGLRALCEDFETTYNCKLVIDPTSGNGDRLNKLMAEKDAPTADVALLTKSFAEIGNQQGLFEKIDETIVPSVADLYDFAKNADGYGPCYSLVRYGIMYNADSLAADGLEAPTSYIELFDDKYAGRVALPDMTSTVGPYILISLAEDLGGSQEDVSAAFEFMKEKKDNIDMWYTAQSDVVNAFTTGEKDITIFMDINMEGLLDSGLNMVWTDAKEGSFAAPATVNVVKGCQNPELAQLFVEYLIGEDAQNRIAGVMDEAPTNKKGSVPEELQKYLASGEESMSALREFDEAYITAHKNEWIDQFQREVNI